MGFKWFIIASYVVCCYLQEVFTFCPSQDELAPHCKCRDLILYCDVEEEADVIGYFDRISALIPEETVYDRFRLSNPTWKEIPAGTFKKLKFRNMTLSHNHELEYIHPDAFGATLETTTMLEFKMNGKLTNEGLSDPAFSLFNVVNKFQNLEALDIYYNPIPTLPDNAFGSLPNLRYLFFELTRNGAKKTFGSKPFAGLPQLETLMLYLSDISQEEIAEDAFEGIAKDAFVKFYSFNFTTLSEKIFKPLLDGVKHVKIRLPPDNDGMNCNENSAWICKDVPKYKGVLEGFGCPKDSGFSDIFDYCEKVVNKN